MADRIILQWKQIVLQQEALKKVKEQRILENPLQLHGLMVCVPNCIPVGFQSIMPTINCNYYWEGEKKDKQADSPTGGYSM